MKRLPDFLRPHLLTLLVFIVFPAQGQNGDKPGHDMAPPPAHWKIPAAPVVSAADAPSTFALEEGFELDLVAAEPMVREPVALVFDGNGRIWVAEMTGYMPDIDGKLEESTYGRISVLEDTDADGKLDRHSVFLEDYLLPRSVALVDADRTLLFADNEKLYEAEILIDGAGLIKAGKVTVVDETFAEGGNPEHKPNGLIHGLDNWIYNAKCDLRYKKINGVWIKEKTEERGQWGIVQDNYGRLFTNTNSNLISAEEVPPGVRIRNAAHAFRTSTNSTIKNQQLWPARINPGVNRGYMEGTLDEKGYLQKPTAASGMAVYRGDQFPVAFRNSLFIAEPAGNLVKRAVISEGDNGFRTIRSATEGSEFFTSTDERCRIVNLHNAPDGSLYLVDFYRGILQHSVYMTSYLRAQVAERELDKHVGLGRIWRVRHTDGKKESVVPRMQAESTAALVSHLARENGWWRDTAQRLIVERGGDEAVEGLCALVADRSNELAAIHAVWALEGLGKLDPAILKVAFDHPSPRTVAEAVRASESLSSSEVAGEVFSLLTDLSATENLHLRRQLASSLGLFGERSVPVLAELLQNSGKDTLVGDLAVSGLSGREFALFKLLPVTHSLRQPLIETLVKRNDRKQLDELAELITTPSEFKTLARISATLRRSDEAASLLAMVADEKTASDTRKAIVDGLLTGAKDKKFKPMPVKDLRELDLAGKEGFVTEAQRKELAALFKVGSGEEEVFLLTDAHRRQFKEGEVHYQRICLGCHQIHGNGQQYLAPPLVGSEWVLESEKRLIALVMDGVMGPIEVLGKTYTVPEIQPMMPGLRMNPEFTDEQLAAIMTYVRNAWGNGAPPVSSDTVRRYRESVAARAPWTPEELRDLK